MKCKNREFEFDFISTKLSSSLFLGLEVVTEHAKACSSEQEGLGFHSMSVPSLQAATSFCEWFVVCTIGSSPSDVSKVQTTLPPFCCGFTDHGLALGSTPSLIPSSSGLERGKGEKAAGQKK